MGIILGCRETRPSPIGKPLPVPKPIPSNLQSTLAAESPQQFLNSQFLPEKQTQFLGTPPQAGELGSGAGLTQA
jgi:hypothetical protein